MKKFLAVLMSIILLLGVCVINISATDEKQDFGSYYKYDFSEQNLYTNYVKNAKNTYNGISYMPLASTGETQVAYGNVNGKDALRIKTSGTTTFVPLKSDGTPFVMEAGKSYTVNFTVVVKRSSARWSRVLFTPYSDVNGEITTTSSQIGPISYVKDDTSEKVYSARSLYGPGSSSSQWIYLDWSYDASKHSGTDYTHLPAYSKSGTTFKAQTGYDTYVNNKGDTKTFNKVITIKSDEQMKDLGVTANANGTYEKNGVTYTNFFAIELSGVSTYYTSGEDSDALVTATDDKGNKYYQMYSDYYITNLEIISDDYVATVDLMNGEEKLKTVPLSNGLIKNSDMVVPSAPAKTYFAGWYYDKECTNLYDGKTALVGVDKLYAGFKTYKNIHTENYEDFDAISDKTVIIPNLYTADYTATIAAMGYAPKSKADDGMMVTTGTNSKAQNKDTLKYSSWGQSTVHILRDENGEAFRVKEGYTYTVRVKYKMTEYSGTTSKIYAGYGIPVDKATVTNYGESKFSYTFDALSVNSVSNEFEEYSSVFTVNEGELKNNFDVVGIYLNIGASNIDKDTGEVYSQNRIVIESISIEGYKQVYCNVDYNGGRPYWQEIGEIPTTKLVFEGKTFEPFTAYKNGCKFIGWFTNEALTESAVDTMFKENETYYAKWIKYGDSDENDKVDTTDLALLKLYLAGLDKVSIGADNDDDGQINTTDLASLKLFLAGLEELGPKDDDWRTHPEDFKLIALTFDDAPSYSTTTQNSTVKIIDTINRYQGAGTLFVVGTNVEKNGTALLEYALNHNFELGNHSYSHADLGAMDDKAAIKQEIVKVNEMIAEKLGVTIKYFRPGYGSANAYVYECTTELNMPIIWSGISGIADYDASVTTKMIEDKVINGASDGCIVLLHGQINNTADAMENICNALYSQGYRFVTVSELFRYKGIDINTLPTNKFINTVNY